MLEQILRSKLKQARVKSFRAGAKALAAHLLKQDASEFNWIDPAEPDADHVIDVTLSEEDERKIERVADAYTDGTLAEISAKILKDVADDMLERHWREWYAYRRGMERHLSTFRNNLEERWGKALDGLRLLLDACSDEGSKYQKQGSRSRKVSSKREALLKLHIRACQVMAEVICLLENGFANGALARWRTLYEIEVIASILAEGDEELAARYLDHEIVDNKRAADIYQKNYEDEGTKALSKAAMRDIDRAFKKVMDLYGKEFTANFGWASKILGNKAPRFTDLEAKAGGARLRNRYKQASHSIHASASFFSNNLADMRSEGVVISGSTNAGLAPPGHLAALTLKWPPK